MVNQAKKNTCNTFKAIKLDVIVETKTKDDVFVKLKVSWKANPFFAQGHILLAYDITRNDVGNNKYKKGT